MKGIMEFTLRYIPATLGLYLNSLYIVFSYIKQLLEGSDYACFMNLSLPEHRISCTNQVWGKRQTRRPVAAVPDRKSHQFVFQRPP